MCISRLAEHAHVPKPLRELREADGPALPRAVATVSQAGKGRIVGGEEPRPIGWGFSSTHRNENVTKVTKQKKITIYH